MMEMFELRPRNLERARREVEMLSAGVTRRQSPVQREVKRRLDQERPRENQKRGRWRPGARSQHIRLVEEVERRHELHKGDIYLESNVARIVAARREAFVLLRAEGLSYPEIGFMFGMHHTTVLHHVRKAQSLGCGKTFGEENVLV